MADTTRFGHDQLGHLLADYLLEVPRFQRSYSWDEGNVEEFLSDLSAARKKDADYFMGTVVFARPGEDGDRRRIVDGQQRLATTAILFIAIRDRLHELERSRQADEIEKRFLRGYVIAQDDVVERLILSPDDLSGYQHLLNGESQTLPSNSLIRKSYDVCAGHVAGLAPRPKQHENLIQLSQQLENRVQVLVAEATDLPEAYVIFETLNDRGADLTTADLLKNFLFSAAGQYFRFVEDRWAQLESNFDRPEDLVKFIRYHHVSRHGSVSGRKLYRAIQSEVGDKATSAKQYIDDLMKAQQVYLALRDPEHSYWNNVNVDVRDALYAYRRFGFEASIPVLLAGFAKWSHDDAARLLVKVANWSVRSTFAGRLGGGVADETFGETARAISSRTARNQTSVRTLLAKLIPNDVEFMEAFVTYGDVSASRAKYLLAMLEKADEQKHQRPARPVDWYSRAVTLEHILPLSAANSESTSAAVNRIGNLALLEKRLNKSAGRKPFEDKRAAYRDSSFELTKRLASKRTWRTRSITDRSRELALLAAVAWPDK